MLTGTVIWYNAKKGIGFINPDQGGEDVFIHMRALKASGIKQVKDGEMLTYELVEDPETGRAAAGNISRLTEDEAKILTKSPASKAAGAKAPVVAPTPKKTAAPAADASAFAKLGLDDQIVSALSIMGYETPTPIQAQAIPLVIEGRDIVGLAQTGTGKTAAFGLPLIHKLLTEPQELKKRATRALILTPTRELALQIHDNFVKFGRRLPLSFTHAIGGAPIRKQMQILSKGVDILVATPGRLEDLVQQKGLRLDQTTFVVLDEADQMMDIGFMPAVKRVLKLVSPDRQTLLFSATMPKAIKELTNEHLNDPAEVTVSPVSSTAENVTQSLMHLVKAHKGLAMERIIKANPRARIIVFARTKHGSDKMVKWLGTQSIPAVAIHGNKSQGQRQRALDDFKKGKVFVMVATDVAARGIDIPGIEIVINYDLPDVPEAYVHRIGRTARAGAKGRAIAFCAPDEAKQLYDIQKLLKIQLPVETMGELTYTPVASENTRPPRAATRGRGRPRDGAPKGGKFKGGKKGGRGGKGR